MGRQQPDTQVPLPSNAIVPLAGGRCTGTLTAFLKVSVLVPATSLPPLRDAARVDLIQWHESHGQWPWRMTVSDLFNGIYLWLASVAPAILLAGILIPVAGTALAWIGKRGNSHADGRFIANLFIGFSLGALLLAVFVMAFAVSILDADPLQANVALLAAPVVCTVGCVLGIGRVFPVNQLASYRSFTDIALFLAACVAIVWLFSKFRGWGILFLGGIPQLLVIGLLAYVVLRRLYNRAFRGKSRAWV